MKINSLKKIAIIFLTTAMFLTSCSTSNLSPLSDLKEPRDKNKSYVVRTGDILNVQVWGEPKISGEVVVRQDGRFSMPLLDEVQAEGLNLTQITETLTTRLSEFIPSASVNISLSQSSSIVYYLSGTFSKPGEFRTDKQVTVLQAVATGGGFAPFANKSNLILIRKVGDIEKRYKLDYEEIVNGNQPNPQLESGDIISVQ